MRTPLLLLLAATLQAEVRETTRVCFRKPSIDLFVLAQVKLMSARIFDQATVDIQWSLSMRECPSRAIQVDIRENAPRNLAPKAMASARPFEGRSIEIFLDRVTENYPGLDIRRKLAFVLAHEIMHLLQGVDTHAPEGIMKARWDDGDYQGMYSGSFRFMPGDLSLMRESFRRRRLAAETRN